ncbi:MAG: hypothetical protein NNA22_12205, partial [Nitrospira sp.]|nr:hypothetical protein [Nitrospira sp.]
MTLQFDADQPFRLDAIAAVTDLFDGQPQGAPEYAVFDLKVESLNTGHSAGSKDSVFGIQDRAMIVCSEKPLPLELIRAMAEKKPERVV